MHTLLRLAGTVAAVVLTVQVVPGLAIAGGWVDIVLLALVWSALMMVVKPILSILTFPITIMTLGLSSFVLNALLFFGMQWLVPSFTVAGPVPALLGALVLSIMSWVLHKVL
jgi:putative membrane protein